MNLVIDIIGKGNLTPFEIILLENSLILLVALPVVTTLAGIFRHFVGLKSLSVHSPIILTFAFYQLGSIIYSDNKDELVYDHNFIRGLVFGLILFAIVFFTTTVLYSSIRKVRMHYVPKTTLVLLGTSITILLSFVLTTRIFERKGLIYLDAFSIIMIATLSEVLISKMSRKNIEETMVVSMQTLIIALLSYLLISLPQSRELILNYTFPLIIAIVLVNVYIGKFLGMRLNEYWRFRNLLLANPSTTRNTNVPKSKKSKKK